MADVTVWNHLKKGNQTDMPTKWKIVIGVAVTFIALSGYGFAIDAADGSIDALDDRKWEQTGGDGVRSAADAYDAGVALFNDTNGSDLDIPMCSVLEDGHDGYLAGDYSEDDMQMLIDSTNEFLIVVGEGADWGTMSIYLASGWWDQATRTCPEAFFELKINGRPAG